MQPASGDALLPLHSAAGAVDALRALPTGADEARGAILATIDAAEAVLRRMLRDASAAPLPLRLRALAPDELPPDELIAELRQQDQVSIELAALFHEMLGIRRRVGAGQGMEPRDREIVLRAVERLRVEASAPAMEPAAAPPIEGREESISMVEEPGVHAVPASGRRRAPALGWIAGATVLLLLLVVGGAWWLRGRRDGGVEQGIALFRSGDYAAAGPFFERYAAERPDDPTPHLYLGRIYRREGRFGEAAAELRRGLELAPRDPMLQRELGFLLLDGGQAEAAVERFRMAVQLDPAAREGWIGLVRALRAAGQPGAAERVIERAPAEVRALLRSATELSAALPYFS